MSRDKGDLHLYKEGKTWYARLWLPVDPMTGKRKKKAFSGRTKVEAKEKAHAFQKLLDNGISTETRELLIRDFLPMWVDSHILANNLADSSRATYLTMSRKIIEVMGNYRLREVTPLVIDKLLKIDPEVRDITVRRYRLLKSMFQDLELRGEIERTPFARHKAPKKPRKSEARFLEEKEIPGLLELVEGSALENLTKFLLSSGTRISEALALRWSDIEIDGILPVAHITRSLRTTEGKVFFKEGKTKNSQRSIELSGPIVSVLQRQRTTTEAASIIREGWSDNGLIFPSSVGTPQDANNVRKIWNRLLKGSDLEGIGFHTLRHTHISIALMKGENIFAVSRRAGHADASFTMNEYGHRMLDQQSIAASVMDEFLS